MHDACPLASTVPVVPYAPHHTAGLTMIVRIYTGDDGQSHFEEVDMESGSHPWGDLRGATGVIFNRSQIGSFSDWHNAPRRQFVITLSGAMEVGIADGTLRQFGPRLGTACRRPDWSGAYHADGRRRAQTLRIRAYSVAVIPSRFPIGVLRCSIGNVTPYSDTGS